MVTLKVDPKDLKRIKGSRRDLHKWAKGGFTKSIDTLLAFSKTNGGHPSWKNRTGKTAQSLERTILQSGVKGRIHSPSPIAGFLYYGTSRHWVEPVRASALSWVDPKSGTRLFSMGHWVSGIKADHWVEKAYIKKQDTLNGYIEDSIIKGAIQKWQL
jgi:hypothetical protein